MACQINNNVQHFVYMLSVYSSRYIFLMFLIILNRNILFTLLRDNRYKGIKNENEILHLVVSM